MSSIFKAYDIRGIYPDEVFEELAFKVGKAVALHLLALRDSKGSSSAGSERRACKLVVGRDGRTSSKSLMENVVEGIRSTGCDVVLVNEATTPLFYFSVNTSLADGGIMVTASHNPKEYNGFKIVGPRAEPISGDSGLLDIEKLLDEPFDVAQGKQGSVDEQEFVDDYVNFILEETRADQEDLRQMKIVIDASNGMSSLVLKNLFRKINLTVVPLFFDIDGTFPNHSPDTSLEETLRHLKEKVVYIGASLGAIFDGDGDRLVLVDEKGQTIRPDIILGLLFEASGNPLTVYDIQASRSIKQLLGEKGVPSRHGAVFLKTLMRQKDASLGGELSGHFFFKELHYNESAVLALMKILVSLNRSPAPISKIVKPLEKYAHADSRLEIPDPDSAYIFKNLKEKYADGRISEDDGLTVEYPDWWFNICVSNTEPVMRLVIEADSRGSAEQKKKELEDYIAALSKLEEASN